MEREVRAGRRSSRPRKLLEWVSFFWASDYHLATSGLAALARREAMTPDQRFSDHAPLIIDDDFAL